MLNHLVKAAALIGLSAVPAFAVCPQPHPRVCAEFFKSDAVFMGTVIAERTVPEGGGFLDGWIYELRVQKTLRGPSRKTISVFTENSSGRFPLELSRQYLLFAAQNAGRLVIDNCGNSGQLSEANDALSEIERIKGTPPGGEIAGRIMQRSQEGHLGPAAAGIRIIARSGEKTYTALSNGDGGFRIHVPAGKYTVHVESPQWTVSPHDLSYDDPTNIIVHNGGCAQLQFVATPK